MSTDDFAFVAHAAHDTLRRWSLMEAVSGQTLASQVARGLSYSEIGLPDGTHLTLMRLFSPVIHREEVFLGSVLLNNFFSKALIRTVDLHDLGRIALLANDLESYYYLYHGHTRLEELVKHLQQEVLACLSNLYFGDEDPVRGIHGKLQHMFTFTKSDFEPIPVYAIPQFLALSLEQAIREQLQTLLTGDSFKKNVRTVLAALSFFYGQNSGGEGDAQSFAMFLFRLIEVYKLVSAQRVADIFGLEVVTKEQIKLAIDNGQYSEDDFRDLILELLTVFQATMDEGSDDWFLGFIRKDKKLIEMTPHEFFTEITARAHLGHVALSSQTPPHTEMCCRLCGQGVANVREQYVTFGPGAFRFHNHSAKLSEKAPALCVKCAVASYVQQRVLGSKEAPAAGKFPQLPRLYTLAFHYGHHDEEDVKSLAMKIDRLFALIESFKQQAREEKQSFSVDYIREHVTQQVNAQQHCIKEHPILSGDEAIAAILADEATAPGLATLTEMNRQVQAQVLSLGVGHYRLLALILPQIQPKREEAKKALNFVQQQFSRSRLAVFTLLALLRKLCGCDGPYYFQSVPSLVPGGFDIHTFYVRGKAESVEKVLRHYSTIVNFARRVSKLRERHSLLIDWMLLAERIEDDPLGTLSEILRRTPLRREDFSPEKFKKFTYKPLAGPQTIDGLQIIDGTEYLKLLEHLRQTFGRGYSGSTKRGEIMPRRVDITELDKFCELLFHTLDGLGNDLLPFLLNERPTAYEKYPRLLLEYIRRYNNVEAGFEEWASKILRDANNYRRVDEFPMLLSVRQWLLEKRDLFEDRKDNLNYLKRSLFSLAFRYLYPRRQLVIAYAEASRGNPAALEEDAIRNTFGQVVAERSASLSDVYGDGEQLKTILLDAEEFLLANRQRYRWKQKEQNVTKS